MVEVEHFMVDFAFLFDTYSAMLDMSTAVTLRPESVYLFCLLLGTQSSAKHNTSRIICRLAELQQALSDDSGGDPAAILQAFATAELPEQSSLVQVRFLLLSRQLSRQIPLIIKIEAISHTNHNHGQGSDSALACIIHSSI